VICTHVWRVQARHDEGEAVAASEALTQPWGQTVEKNAEPAVSLMKHTRTCTCPKKQSVARAESNSQGF
jgi:hypothetical protein